jgi:transposase
MGRRLRSRARDSGHYGVASDGGADRAAVMNTLIMTARLNDIDPKAWLADVFTRIASIPQSRLHELLPWEWKRRTEASASAQAA